MPDADALGWLIASVTILFLIWMGLRAETRKARGVLETREERMLREMAEPEANSQNAAHQAERSATGN